MSLLLVSDDALYTVWGVSLAIGLVVAVVVAAMLIAIERTARNIDDEVGAIWFAGQRVANNTVHIPLLGTTNRVLLSILVRVAGVDSAAKAIEEHADRHRPLLYVAQLLARANRSCARGHWRRNCRLR
jgi:hypothetical protein